MARVTVVLRVVPAVVVPVGHPAALGVDRAAVRGAEKSEQHVIRLAGLANNVWTVPVFQRVMLVNNV